MRNLSLGMAMTVVGQLHVAPLESQLQREQHVQNTALCVSIATTTSGTQ